MLHINPSVFAGQFLAAYANGGTIWKYRDWLPDDRAVVQKYRFLRDWLDLDKTDPIAVEIRKLEQATTPADRNAFAEAAKALIKQKYGV